MREMRVKFNHMSFTTSHVRLLAFPQQLPSVALVLDQSGQHHQSRCISSCRWREVHVQVQSPQVEGSPTALRSPLLPWRNARTDSLRDALGLSLYHLRTVRPWIQEHRSGLTSQGQFLESPFISQWLSLLSVWLLHPLASLTVSRKTSFFSGGGLAAAVSSEDQVRCRRALTEDPENLRGKQKG